jgi:hypothetical protein
MGMRCFGEFIIRLIVILLIWMWYFLSLYLYIFYTGIRSINHWCTLLCFWQSTIWLRDSHNNNVCSKTLKQWIELLPLGSSLKCTMSSMISCMSMIMMLIRCSTYTFTLIYEHLMVCLGASVIMEDRRMWHWHRRGSFGWRSCQSPWIEKPELKIRSS